jgi:hypothetical protein
MEHVREAQPVAIADRADPGEDFGKLRARHHGVVHVEVRRETAHGAEGALPGPPEALALLGVARHLGSRRAGLGREAAHPLGLQRHRLGWTVELDQQHGARIHRQAGGVDAGLDGLDGAPVDDLERGRHQPAADDRRHRATRGDHVREDGQQRLDRLGQRREPHRHLGHHAERALAADHGADQVVARAAGRAAEPGDAAVGQHQLQAEHVVRGGAVLERVGSARVLGHVAADRAGRLARGIRRVEETEGSGHLRELRVHDPRLHHGEAVRGIEGKDAVHARALDHHAALGRHRAAGEARASAARHEGDAGVAARPHHGRHLRGLARQHHRGRARGIQGEAVGLVGEELLGA